MSKILKDVNGDLYIAHTYEKLNAEQAQDLLSGLQSDVALIESVATPTSDPVNDAAPADNQVTDPNAPAVPDMAATPTDQTPPASPAAVDTSTDQPADNTAAPDPNAVPPLQ